MPTNDDVRILKARGEYEGGDHYLAVYYRVYNQTFRVRLVTLGDVEALEMRDAARVDPDDLFEVIEWCPVGKVPAVVREAATLPVQVPDTEVEHA